MYIQGKVIQIFDIQSGESSKGTWRKREFILETYAKIPKKVCLVIKGDLIDNFKLNIGDSLKISVDIESREYKDRWYTEIRAWKIEPAVLNEGSPSDAEDHPF